MKWASNYIKATFKMIWTSNYYQTLRSAAIIIQRNVKIWYSKNKLIIDMTRSYFEEVQMPEKIKMEQDYLFNVYKRQEHVEQKNTLTEYMEIVNSQQPGILQKRYQIGICGTDYFDNSFNFLVMDKIYLFTYILDLDILSDHSESYSEPWGKTFQEIYKKNYLNQNFI